MRGRRTAVTIAAAVVLGVGFAACGDDDEEPASAPAATAAPAETPAATQEAQQDIVALAQATPDLSTLVSALQAADLVETLQGKGPFTVFAPSNDAFEAVGKETLDPLLEPAGKKQLSSILTYHVVPGELKAADLEDGQQLETVNGETLSVKVADGAVMVGEATVVTPDVDASNGVVHVIDGVLMPKG